MHSSEIGEQMYGKSPGVWRRAGAALDPLLTCLLDWSCPKEAAVVPVPSAEYPSGHPWVLERPRVGPVAFLCAQPRNFTFSLARGAWLSGLNISPVRVKRNATFSRILKQPRPPAQRTEIVHTIHSCLSRLSTGKLIFSSAHAEVPSRLPGWAGASVIRL